MSDGLALTLQVLSYVTIGTAVVAGACCFAFIVFLAKGFSK